MKKIKTEESIAFDKKVGERVRKISTQQGFRVWSLAEAVGIPESTMYAIEAGQRSIRLIDAVRICKALGISLSELVKDL